jgi:hypothetical protein
MVCPDGSDRTFADMARLRLRLFLVISEIFHRPKKKISDGESGKYPLIVAGGKRGHWTHAV